MASAFASERLHHVQLDIPAGAEDLCREFWAGALGMTELAKPLVPAARGGCCRPWMSLRGGGVGVHLGVVSDFTPAGRSHPGILVDALAALAARPEAHGHPVLRDGDFPGYRRSHTRDALGNRPEFLEPEPVG